MIFRLEKNLSAYENKNKIKRLDKDSETYLSCLKAAKTKERKLTLTTIHNSPACFWEAVSGETYKEICKWVGTKWFYLLLFKSTVLYYLKKTLFFRFRSISWVCFKGEFAVVPTAKICGRSLSVKIPVDMNSIFMKLYVTWPTWPRSHTSEIWSDFCRF